MWDFADTDVSLAVILAKKVHFTESHMAHICREVSVVVSLHCIHRLNSVTQVLQGLAFIHRPPEMMPLLYWATRCVRNNIDSLGPGLQTLPEGTDTVPRGH